MAFPDQQPVSSNPQPPLFDSERLPTGQSLVHTLQPSVVGVIGLARASPEHTQNSLQNTQQLPFQDELLPQDIDGKVSLNQLPSALTTNFSATREARRARWQETGYIPPLAGGSDAKKENVTHMNWELFDTDPIAARKQLTVIFQTEYPEWDEVQIARRVASGELSRKLELHDKLREQFGESDERVQTLYEEIRFWRLVLRGF